MGVTRTQFQRAVGIFDEEFILASSVELADSPSDENMFINVTCTETDISYVFPIPTEFDQLDEFQNGPYSKNEAVELTSRFHDAESDCACPLSDCRLGCDMLKERNVKRIACMCYFRTRENTGGKANVSMVERLLCRLRLYAVNSLGILDMKRGWRSQLTPWEVRWLVNLAVRDPSNLSFSDFELVLGVVAAYMNFRLLYFYHLLAVEFRI